MSLLNLTYVGPDDPSTGVWPLPKGQHVVLSPDLRAEWWGKWGMNGRVWCVIDFDADENWFDVREDCAGATPEWWANYDGGLYGLLCGTFYDEALEFLLHKGIAPGQPFRLDFEYACGVDCNGEGWDEFRCKVIDRERWDDKQVRFAWLRWNAAQEGR